jgi:uncharacterized protein (TIGR04255 family)
MNRSETIPPEYERVLFKNAALELCLVQLRYPPIPRFSEEKFLLGIKEALAEEYPLISTEQGMNIVIGLQGISQAPGSNMLRFNTIDSLWSVVLTSETVSLETREYTGISEFARRWTDILRIVATHFQPRHQLRIGLRYVNEFRYPSCDSYDTWRKLLNPALLNLDINSVLGGDIEQTIGEVRTRRDDGIVLLRHGFLKGTTVIPTPKHPAKIGAFYLLDLDYYDETATNFSVTAPAERIERYNDFLYRIFRWSIGQSELYEYLRGEQ